MDLGSIFNISGIAGAATKLVTVGLPVLIFLGILGAGAYYIYLKKAYDTDVIIFSERAGGLSKIIMDKGAFITKKGGGKLFKLWKLKISMAPPAYNLLIPSRGRNYLLLRQTSEDEIHPLNYKFEKKVGDDNKIVMTAVDSDIRLFIAAMVQEIKETYTKESLLKQYAPIIGMVMGCLFLMIVMIYFINKSGDILNAANAFRSGAMAVGAGP